MTRNLVSDEQAEANRTVRLPGAYTFNAYPPKDYTGFVLCVATLRLGDHAHLDIDTGRQTSPPIHGDDDGPWADDRTNVSRSHAGRLVMRWDAWLKIREMLELVPWTRIAEVEKPNKGQLDYHAGGAG